MLEFLFFIIEQATTFLNKIFLPADSTHFSQIIFGIDKYIRNILSYKIVPYLRTVMANAK